MKKIGRALLVVIALVTLLSVVFVRWEKLCYRIDSYTAVCVKDDLNSWVEYGFGLSDSEKLDIIKNPADYYVVTFDGELRNNHIYGLYNWYVTEKKPLSFSKSYWIDSRPIDATFKFEPFSDFYTKSRVLIKCNETEITSICEEIMVNQLLLGKGDIYVK